MFSVTYESSNYDELKGQRRRPRLKVSFWHADEVPRFNRKRRRQGIFLPNLFTGMADQHRIFIGPVGKASGGRNRSKNIKAAGESVFSGCRDFTENINGPERNNGDCDFGILQEFASRISSRESMLDIASCATRRRDRPNKRHGDSARR